MTSPFSKCEAIKYALRQSRDGTVISFVVQPADLPPELTLAKIGTRVLLAVAEINDDETLKDANREPGTVKPGAAERRDAFGGCGDDNPVHTTQGQCDTGSVGVRSASDPGASLARRARAKAQYAAAPEWRKAAMRASILCGDEKFQKWMASKLVWSDSEPILVPTHPADFANWAAHHLRRKLGITSRAEIGTDRGAYERFIALETEYRISQGMMAEPLEAAP